MKAGHLLGKTAENYAALFFKRKGYLIMVQNFRYQKAEIDLILRKNNTLVCVEVKARSYDYYGHPSTFVTAKKRQLLCKAMDYFAQNCNEDLQVRFDILCLYKVQKQWQIDHLENAFHCMD